MMTTQLPDSVAPELQPTWLFYRQRSAEYEQQATQLDRIFHTLGWIRLATAIGAIAFSIALFSSLSLLNLAGLFVCLIAFLALGIRLSLFAKRIAESRERKATCDRAAARLDGGWRQFPAWKSLGDPVHYLADLDICGESSLLQKISIAKTKKGANELQSWLSQLGSPETIRARQSAIKELSGRQDALIAFEASLGGTRKQWIDPTPFLQLVQEPNWLIASSWLSWVPLWLPLLTIATGLAHWTGVIPFGIEWFLFVIQVIIVLFTESKAIDSFRKIEAKVDFANAYDGALRWICQEHFESEQLQKLQSHLRSPDKNPVVAMRKLFRWSGFADLHQQPLFHIAINALLLWDLNCIRWLEKWKEQYAAKCEDWFDTVAAFEALASLSQIAITEHPVCFPQVDDSQPGFSAVELMHPLLDSANRVGNSVDVGSRSQVIVLTGSNMAGKSTLLRAIGTNIALAFAGGPVCATQCSVRPMRLRTSIRIRDSLRDGSSYFHAELSQISAVIDKIEQVPPVFFLLDEVLRGTNAHARHQGAVALIRFLVENNALGVVATHDAELANLEATLAGKVSNQHFTDEIRNGVMRFDYRLRPGVVKGGNALRLLSMAGIPISDESV